MDHDPEDLRHVLIARLGHRRQLREPDHQILAGCRPLNSKCVASRYVVLAGDGGHGGQVGGAPGVRAAHLDLHVGAGHRAELNRD